MGPCIRYDQLGVCFCVMLVDSYEFVQQYRPTAGHIYSAPIWVSCLGEDGFYYTRYTLKLEYSSITPFEFLMFLSFYY